SARLTRAHATQDDLADSKLPSDERIEDNAARRDVAPTLRRLEVDVEVMAETVEGFDLDQRDVAAAALLVGVRPLAHKVAVALQPAAGDGMRLLHRYHRLPSRAREMNACDDAGRARLFHTPST